MYLPEVTITPFIITVRVVIPTSLHNDSFQLSNLRFIGSFRLPKDVSTETVPFYTSY